MPITSDYSKYYRTDLLSQRLIEIVLFSSPLLAFTGPGADDMPNRYSGKDSFLIQLPFVSTQEGEIDDTFMLGFPKGGVNQKTMRIDFKRVSGAVSMEIDNVKFLFNLDKFPANVPTSMTSFMERGERIYQELLIQVIKSINDYQFKTIASRGFICAGSTDDSMYDCIERIYQELLIQVIKSINDYQFKTIASRGFICAGSTDDSMYDCIEGYIRQLIDYMIRVNGGVLRTSRLIGSMPNSAMGLLRTKSGLNYTQAPKSDMFLSDTKNMLSSLTFDCAEIYIDTSTCFHQAGRASEKENLTLTKIDKEMDEYHSMTLTFSGTPPSNVDEFIFNKGDIIQLEDKEWLARDRKGVSSGVPIALTVMEDSNEETVRVSPGITPGVDVPKKNYLIGAKAKVVGDHCKAFLWWQPASIFKLSPVPAPSTTKYLYREISAPNAAFGPTRNNAMSFLIDSTYVLVDSPYEVGELMAYMYTDFFPFFVGTLILPPKSPKPETYIKTIKNLSTADKKKEDKSNE